MTSRDFCYWLQGYFEISMATGKEGFANTFPQLDREQIWAIQNHLNLVFKHEIDPSMGGNQAELQQIHDGKPQIGGTDAQGNKLRC